MLEKLIIGTVQFGLNYGITNLNGKVTNNDIDKIFKFCEENQLYYFDTAQDYGDSEDILAKQIEKNNKLKIITKGKFNYKNIDDVINKSIHKFNNIDCFLLHSYDDYKHEIINKLIFYKNKNFIKKIGISIYTVEEAIKILDDYTINVIQLPYNYIDNQWDNPIFKHKLKIRYDVEIHVRSIFLQGLLLNKTVNTPKNIAKEDFDYLNKIIDEITTELNINKIELCFGYINSCEWIHKFLIGIDNFEHLKENYEIINKNIKLTTEQMLIIKEKTKNINNLICNPSKWKF